MKSALIASTRQATYYSLLNKLSDSRPPTKGKVVKCAGLSPAHFTTHTTGGVVLPAEAWTEGGLLVRVAEIARNLVDEALTVHCFEESIIDTD